jgi:hypothetical protein
MAIKIADGTGHEFRGKNNVFFAKAMIAAGATITPL